MVSLSRLGADVISFFLLLGLEDWSLDVGVEPKIGGKKPPQIIHLFIGFGTIIFTIHFGVPLFLETAMFLQNVQILPENL